MVIYRVWRFSWMGHLRKAVHVGAESLDTVNQALEAMYDDMFQDVAMDISSDIKVLETMLAKDGWGGQTLRSGAEPGASIWDKGE